MGKKQFLRELNRKLRTLEKSERRRYLDDYEEMIADMVEGGLTEEEAVSRLGSPEKIGETLLENTEPESRRRIDVPGTLLAALSLVLTAVSVWRYLTIRSIFGTFAGLSEQSVSVIGGAAPLSTAPDLSGFRCPGFHMIPHPRISGSGAGQIPCRRPPACPGRGWCRPVGACRG